MNLIPLGLTRRGTYTHEHTQKNTHATHRIIITPQSCAGLLESTFHFGAGRTNTSGKQMTPLLCTTIFLSEKAEGLVLVGSLLCHPVHFLGSERRDETRIAAFECQRPRHHFLCLFCLQPLVPVCRSIFIPPSFLRYFLPPSPPPCLYSSIWPQLSLASFPMWSPASRTYCPCTACTLISCNMVSNGLLFHHVQEFHNIMLSLWMQHKISARELAEFLDEIGCPLTFKINH